ncbi:MAG: 50S ribosomal protein L3 [bacterium]|nr:50S ribosomal protein L3 [bacterium]
MQFLIATKLHMTQRYDGDRAVATTVLRVAPCTVTQVKTVQQDGYAAVQVASGERRGVNRALLGHFGGKKFRFAREVRVADPAAVPAVGDCMDAATFKPGDRVTIVAVSKGKGFAGVVKRHHFHGHNATHGTKDQVRMPGSIGGGGRAGGRVIKGMRMAGRMGSDRVTVKNLTVVATDPAAQIIELRGAVPGARGAVVEIRSYNGYWVA